MKSVPMRGSAGSLVGITMCMNGFKINNTFGIRWRSKKDD
jgi:hypothetical protein